MSSIDLSMYPPLEVEKARAWVERRQRLTAPRTSSLRISLKREATDSSTLPEPQRTIANLLLASMT